MFKTFDQVFANFTFKSYVLQMQHVEFETK